MANAFLKATYAFMAGLGYVPAPPGGNQDNAPADPPVQEGNYQFIQPTMYGPARGDASGDNWYGADQAIVNIPDVPPAWQDNNTFPLNTFGLSGLEGGGSTGEVPSVDNGTILYYDEQTGTYINLGPIG